MALLHRATLSPTKAELIAGWLPRQPWYDGPADQPPAPVGAYRFDDPAGEVGLEVHLVRVGDGPVIQVPFTYRAVPLAGAEDVLVGTTEHSVLGRRWVYDGTGDPVFVQALADAILTGGREAELWVESEEGRQRREPTVRVQGSGAGAPVPAGPTTVADDGTGTVMSAPELVLVLLHVPGGAPAEGTEALTGTWPGRDEPALLATAHREG